MSEDIEVEQPHPRQRPRTRRLEPLPEAHRPVRGTSLEMPEREIGKHEVADCPCNYWDGIERDIEEMDYLPYCNRCRQ